MNWKELPEFSHDPNLLPKSLLKQKIPIKLSEMSNNKA